MILQDNWGSTENDCYNARLEKEIQSLKECIWRLNQEKEQLKADKKWLLNKIRYALGEHWVPESSAIIIVIVIMGIKLIFAIIIKN